MSERKKHHKKGISALELQRKLGINCYKTAWTLEHKIREAMFSSGNFPLKNLVEADETYVGGAVEGKAGRGAAGKSLVAGTVEVNPETEAMGRAYLKKIPTHSSDELSAFINPRVAKGAKVKTDGLPSYNFLYFEYKHITTKVKDTKNKGEVLPKFHIVISNFKTWMRVLLTVFRTNISSAILKNTLSDSTTAGNLTIFSINY